MYLFVLIFLFIFFQNILENIKSETVKQDLLTGQNGAMKLTDEELLNLTNFSKMVSPKRIVGEGKPLFVVIYTIFNYVKF